jgi:hypothetical protein
MSCSKLKKEITMYEKLQPHQPADNAATLIPKNVSDFQRLNGDRETRVVIGRDVNLGFNADRPVLIVAPGPSAREGLSERVQAHKDAGGVVVLAGGASMFLNKGVDGSDAILTPDQVDAVVYSNPDSDHAGLIKEGTDLTGVSVYMATHCRSYETLKDSEGHVLDDEAGNHLDNTDAPDVYQRIERAGGVLCPFHAHTEGVHEPEFTPEGAIHPQAPVVLGYGHGAVVGGMSVMSALGHRDFETIGWDGYPEYAVSLDDTPDYKKKVGEEHVILDIGGKKTAVFGPFAGDPTEFVQFVTHYPEAIRSLHVLGGGAVAQILTPDDRPRSDFSNVKIGSDDLGHNNAPKETAETGSFPALEKEI